MGGETEQRGVGGGENEDDRGAKGDEKGEDGEESRGERNES